MNEIILILDYSIDVFDITKDKTICELIDEKKIIMSMDLTIPKENKIYIKFNDPWDRLTVRAVFDIIDYYSFYS